MFGLNKYYKCLGCGGKYSAEVLTCPTCGTPMVCPNCGSRKIVRTAQGLNIILDSRLAERQGDNSGYNRGQVRCDSCGTPIRVIDPGENGDN